MVVGELIGVVSSSKNGLAPISMYRMSSKNIITESNSYKIIARMRNVIRGCFFVDMGQQDSAYNYSTAIVNIRNSGGTPAIVVHYLYNAANMKFYYRILGNEVEIAVKDIGQWNHVQSVSFHPDIFAVAEQLNSIDGFIALN